MFSWGKKKKIVQDESSFSVKEEANNTFEVSVEPEGLMQFFEWMEKSPNKLTLKLNGSEYFFAERVDKMLFILGINAAIEIFADKS